MEEEEQRDDFQELEGETAEEKEEVVEEREEVVEETSREVTQEFFQEGEDQGGGGEPMEETVETQGEEEKKEKSGKGLVYLALVFGIVALILSFWNMGLHQVVGVLEHQGKVIEQKHKVLENRVENLQAQALLSKIQLEAQKVYALTMGEGNYEAAAGVGASMEGQLAALKSYYTGKDVQEMEALFKALKAEVAKGPSPIPALVSKIQLVADKLAAEVAPGPKAQPRKEAPVKKESAVKEAPKPEEKVVPEKKVSSEKATEGQVGEAPEGKGVLWSVLRSWNKLGGKIVGK
jgi:hypothetical protein